MRTYQLKDWAVEIHPSDLGQFVLVGAIFGHSTVPDGTMIRTTPIVWVDAEKRVIKTQSSGLYDCAAPATSQRYDAEIDPEAIFQEHLEALPSTYYQDCKSDVQGSEDDTVAVEGDDDGDAGGYGSFLDAIRALEFQGGDDGLGLPDDGGQDARRKAGRKQPA